MKIFGPVFLISFLCKVMGKLIKAHICRCLVQRSLLSSVTRTVVESRQVHVRYPYVSEAWDSENLRFRPSKLQWLRNRMRVNQRLKVHFKRRRFKIGVTDWCASKPGVTSSISQVQLLEPRMFRIFINYLANSPKHSHQFLLTLFEARLREALKISILCFRTREIAFIKRP